MQKRIYICMLICLISFSGFGISNLAQGQTDLKSLTELVNSVFRGPTDLGPWRYTSSMVITKQEAPAVISGNYIYVIGGRKKYPENPYNTVERAKILSDGTLGRWTLEPETLLVPVYGHGAISKNGFIYVISGDFLHAQFTTSVQYTQVNPDGSLQPWQLTSPVQQGRVNFGYAEDQGYIYVMSGNPGKSLYSVEYAKINPDGTLGSWSYTSPMQLARWNSSARAYNSYVYVLGGSLTNMVEYAQINPDGSLGTWSYTSSMTMSRGSQPATAILNNYLYVLGGSDNYNSYTNTIERAFINPDGSLGAWTLLPDTLLDLCSATGYAQDNGHVYLAGGGNSQGTWDDAEMSGVSYLIGGDANCDGIVNASDVIYLVSYLYRGGPPPGCP